MKVLIFLGLFILGSAAYTLAHSQQQGQYETKEILFSIDSFLTVNDSIYAYIGAGRDLGLVYGQKIRLFSKYTQSDSVYGPREFVQKGYGWVTDVADETGMVYIQLSNQVKYAFTGDLVAIDVKVPKLAYRSLFSDLAFMNIIFLDNADQPLYSQKQFLWWDSKKTEDSIMQLIIGEIKQTYLELKDQERFQNLKKPLPGNRFSGKSVFDMMRDVDRNALTGYLSFVKYFPGKYIGHNYRANETYATWVLNNAPYSTREVEAALLPVYKDPVKFKKALPRYSKDIIENNIIASIAEQAIELTDPKDRAKQMRILDFSRVLAYELNDTTAKSYYHYYYAQVLQDQGKFKDAIAECELAMKYATMDSDKEMELHGMVKKAYCYAQIKNYREATDFYHQTLAKIESYKTFLPEGVYITYLRKIYEYEAYLNYAEGYLDKAVTNYLKVVEFNTKINSYESNLGNAQHLNFLGQVYRDQGDYEKAKEKFTTAALFYLGVNDVKNAGLMLSNLSHALYLNGEYRSSMAYIDTTMEVFSLLQDPDNMGYLSSLRGSCYWQLGKYDSAVLAHRTAIELRTENPDGQAYSYEQIGDLYKLSGLKKEALLALDTAAILYDTVKNYKGLADTYIKIGTVHHNDENYLKAVQFYEQARSLNKRSTVEALYNLANTWNQIDKKKAGDYFRQCLTQSDTTGNTQYRFLSRKALASSAFYDADFTTGDKYMKECYQIAVELQSPYYEASYYSLKGSRFFNASQVDSAQYYYEKAISIFDTISQDEKIFQLNSLANEVCISKSEFEKAEKILLEAISLAKSTNNNVALGYSLSNISFLYGLMGDFNRGEAANDSAIAIFKRSGNIIRVATAFADRGSLYKVVGEYSKSIQSFNYADSIYVAEKLEGFRSSLQNNLGVSFYNQGNYTEAIKYFNKAAAYLPKGIINEGYILNRANIAECLYYLKRTAEAKKIYEELYGQAEKLQLKRILSGMATGLGRIYFDENNLDKAYAYFDTARVLSGTTHRERLIEALVNLGKINVKKNRDREALQNYTRAIDITREFRIASGWEAYYELGLLYFRKAQYDSAVAYFRPAVDLLNKYTGNIYGSENEKKLFNNDPRKADLYNSIVYAYGKLGKAGESFAFANLANLAGLAELAGKTSIPGFERETKQLEEKNQNINLLKASAEKQTGEARIKILNQLAIAEKDYTNYLNELIEKDERFVYNYPAGASPLDFYNYQSKIPPDVAVVMYIFHQGKLMVFTLTNESLDLQVDSLSREAGAMIATYISLAKRPQKSSGTGALQVRAESRDEEDFHSDLSFAQVSDQLYKVLVGSIKNKIAGKKRICIVTGGILSNFPFQCLGYLNTENKFRFLIEDHSIFYTNNISVLFHDKPVKTDMTSFAGFGVPDKTLQYNKEEVRQIGKMLGVEQAIFTDKATEGQAKKSLVQKKVVHFATHGVLLYAQKFSNSYLKFLPDTDSLDGNNGRLTINEVQGLLIRDCDLVTLSACETAIADTLVKGFILSPANAFLMRSVKSVVASLWKVDDEATSILMGEFYNNLSHGMDKVDALRNAQVKLSQDPRYAHPFFWGAFVLYGEWR